MKLTRTKAIKTAVVKTTITSTTAIKTAAIKNGNSNQKYKNGALTNYYQLIAPPISSHTQLGTKRQKRAHTPLPKKLVKPITSPITSRTPSRTTTVPKKVRIEDKNSTGKADNASTVQRYDEKEEIDVELNIVWNEPSQPGMKGNGVWTPRVLFSLRRVPCVDNQDILDTTYI